MFYIPRLAMDRARRNRMLVAATLALGLASWGLVSARGEDALRQALVTPGNARPSEDVRRPRIAPDCSPCANTDAANARTKTDKKPNTRDMTDLLPSLQR